MPASGPGSGDDVGDDAVFQLHEPILDDQLLLLHESSSESIHANYALATWGAVIRNSPLQAMAAIMTAAEIRTAQAFYQITPETAYLKDLDYPEVDVSVRRWITTPMNAGRSPGSRERISMTARTPPADAPTTTTSRAIFSWLIETPMERT